MDEHIERESLAYLVCKSCGVVFPDRDNPTSCPICQSASDCFVSYAEEDNKP